MRFVKFIEKDIFEKDLFGNEVFVGKKRIPSNDAISDGLSYGLEIKIGSNSYLLKLDKNILVHYKQ